MHSAFDLTKNFSRHIDKERRLLPLGLHAHFSSRFILVRVLYGCLFFFLLPYCGPDESKIFSLAT